MIGNASDKMRIYLDNAATTKADPEVIKTMLPFQELHTGNASSLHRLGLEAAKGIEKAREIIARKINANPKEIFFTSSGTESNNFAIKGISFATHRKRNHIITSKIEHPSIIEVTKWLQRQGFEITYLSVDKEGFVDPKDVEKAIKKETILVSIGHANNEIGTIEPIEEIGTICRKRGVYFHTDACQSFTKIEIDVKKQNLDLLTLNAHKLHGPKGVGVLYIREGVKIEPLLHGGGQENNLRSGTYNTAGIVGFGRAVEIANITDINRMAKLRDYFIHKLQNNIEDAVLNGPRERRLCNNINLRFRSISGRVLLWKLNEKNIFIATGSACSSARSTPSHVLLGIGIEPESAQRAIRISLSKWTIKDELDILAKNLILIVKKEVGNLWLK